MVRAHSPIAMMLHAVATSGTDPLQVATAPVAEARSVSTSVRARLVVILEGHVWIGRASLGVGTRERMVEERDGLLWPSCLYTSRSAFGYNPRGSNKASALAADTSYQGTSNRTALGIRQRAV